MKDITHLLCAMVGDFDTDMRLICDEGLSESFLLTWGELVVRSAQGKPDLVEGITPAPAVSGRVLLDAATYLIESVTGELDDVKASSTLVASWSWSSMAFLLSLEGIQCRDLRPCTEVFAALGHPVLMRGARSSWDQVQQAGRGIFLPVCQVHDAGQLTWATAASVLVVPQVLIDPQHSNPCETGGVIRCGLQARLDVGAHGNPRGS